VKILVVLHDYLPRHTGGSEIHAHQTARELARRGHAVTALFTERDLAAPEGTVRTGMLDGVRTLEVVHQREYADVRESWEEERSLARFREQLAALRPDVVHFHHLAIWGSRCIPAARASGARVVVTLHDYHLLCDVSTLLRPDGELCRAGLRGDCTACLRGTRCGASAGTAPNPSAPGASPRASASRATRPTSPARTR
jgi:glycosyltransferase involved in cell wall biosynthesis